MARNDLTEQTYLSQIYFEDRKLRDFALSEFFRSARTGRITAFIGSMVTEGLGYPDWAGLLAMSGKAVNEVARRNGATNRKEANAVATCFKDELWSWLGAEMQANDKFDGRIVASVIGHWIDNATKRRGAGAGMNHALAKRLSFYSTKKSGLVERDILEALIHNLGVRRFITTNYDMEIEFQLAQIFNDPVARRYKRLADIEPEFAMQDADLAMQSLVRDDGLVIASDAFHRDRLDRLIEFSLGTSDIDYHVLHLHGRLDKPATMIVGYRDYDRLYRRSGVSKAPFEQALTMLHSSNPILFVGLGMEETELNQVLEYLVGNQPFKGIGRRFLLWSPPAARKLVRHKNRRIKPAVSADHVRAAFRLEKLHKLGVLTIFNDEIIASVASSPSLTPKTTPAAPSDPRAERRRGLAEGILRLGDLVREDEARRCAPIASHAWRTIDFHGDKADDPIYFTWHFARTFKRDEIFDSKFKSVPSDAIKLQRLLVRTSRPGTGKGETATATAIRWAYRRRGDGILEPRTDRPVLLANMSLRLDTDSILESIVQFLSGTMGATGRRGYSRERAFRDSAHQLFRSKDGKRRLIIFKGLERLFSKTGVPLSAEMDQFFRSYLIAVLDAQRRGAAELDRICPIVVFGTRRMRIYFRRLQDQIYHELRIGRETADSDAVIAAACRTIVHVDRTEDKPQGYLQHLRRTFATAFSDPLPRLADDRSYARETYRRVFASSKFQKRFAPNSVMEKVAYAVLTTMAFVGQPVEAEVLFHAPRIAQTLKGTRGKDVLKKILDILSGSDFNLVHRLARPEVAGLSFASGRSYHMDRYALHMTLQAEFRERYGVPLSEAVLSTSFNMSLYAAQPADAAVSEPQIHDELGKLIDWFIGAHRDADVYNPAHRVDTALPKDHPDIRARPNVAAALRAAFAILRGFYSTSALLSLDIGDRKVDELRDGALTEHANRIERLIGAFSKLAAAREMIAEEIGGDHPAHVRERIGPGALYKDELVWLHNERGVVKLTQGDIYEARASLNEADRINTEHVEFGCRSHNWRRIWLNLVVADIESGKLIEAEDGIGRIENSFDSSGQVHVIRQVLAHVEPGMLPQLPLGISHEDCLAAALATGYRGLIMFLRGELHSADGLFQLAITMLENLDEQRACALFRRHRAALLAITHGYKEGAAEAKLAIAGAESVQQMDIVYGARIVRAQEQANSDQADERKSAMTTLTRAIDFSSETDIYRIAIEARRNLAILKLNNGDMESALEHASVAASLAGRYGLSLYKITMRITLGRILYERGAKDAADALIRNAIVQADQIGYQRAVEAAQFAMSRMR